MSVRKLRRWIQMAMFSEPWQPSDNAPPAEVKPAPRSRARGAVISSKARRPSKWSRTA